MLSAFRAAREAYDEHEQVLSLAPQRRDAGLVVGTYRYIVATLSLPIRWVAYVAGFGGGRERGLSLVEGAANYSGENQTDARFALTLLYNRERRYDDALKQLAVLRETYPRNRLVWLESGFNAAARGPRRGRRARTERGHRAVRRRPEAAHVRGRRALALQARRRVRRVGTGGGGRRAEAGDRLPKGADGSTDARMSSSESSRSRPETARPRARNFAPPFRYARAIMTRLGRTKPGG